MGYWLENSEKRDASLSSNSRVVDGIHNVNVFLLKVMASNVTRTWVRVIWKVRGEEILERLTETLIEIMISSHEPLPEKLLLPSKKLHHALMQGLGRILPEDWFANLDVALKREINAGSSNWNILRVLIRHLFGFLWAAIQMPFQNLWLPDEKRKPRG